MKRSKPRERSTADVRPAPAAGAKLATSAAAMLFAALPVSAKQGGDAPAAPTLEETRLTMGKWIETEQILSRERNEWQQAKEILKSRVELVRKEVATLEEKIRQAEAGAAQGEQKKQELVLETETLKTAGAQLAEAVAAMETDIGRIHQRLPEPLQAKLQPLYQRIPKDAAQSRVSIAERFQNVLGILNELNKANNELSVVYEVRTLADGKPSEVRALYVGLAQAYYVSAGGEAGIGRPSPDGWKWEPSKAVANDVLTALDILQGKHTPAFVPLPVKMQ
jgi:hypothetical protein